MKMFENRPKLAALAAAPMMAVAVALAFGTLAGRAVAQNASTSSTNSANSPTHTDSSKTG